MTWALAKLCKVLAVCMSLRNSLKLLKGMSLSSASLSQEGRGVLMFWTICGVFIVFEQYLEYFIRWFPMYYYAKSLFIVLMAVPRLRFTHYVFNNALVPSMEYIHKSFGSIHEMSTADFLLLIPINIALLMFPAHMEGANISDEKAYGEVSCDYNDEGDTDIDLSINLDNDDIVSEVDHDDGAKLTENDNTKVQTPGAHLTPDRASKTPDSNNQNERSENIMTTPVSASKRGLYRNSTDIVVGSMRQLLTGDSDSKMSDSVFNFDLHSPNPNSQYRLRHSMTPGSHASRSPDSSSRSNVVGGLDGDREKHVTQRKPSIYKPTDLSNRSQSGATSLRSDAVKSSHRILRNSSRISSRDRDISVARENCSKDSMPLQPPIAESKLSDISTEASSRPSLRSRLHTAAGALSQKAAKMSSRSRSRGRVGSRTSSRDQTILSENRLDRIDDSHYLTSVSVDEAATSKLSTRRRSAKLSSTSTGSARQTSNSSKKR